MKLTLKIKLLPTDEQSKHLLNTIKEANLACNIISNVVWEKRIFNQFKIHNEVYHSIKQSTNLSAQVIIRCISKVTDAYKLDKKTKRTFRPLGSMTYDPRILSYTPNDTVSIWTVGGRLKKLPFICHNRNYLPYIKGEADLVYKKGKFYLFQTVEVPDEKITDVEEFIGIDLVLPILYPPLIILNIRLNGSITIEKKNKIYVVLSKQRQTLLSVPQKGIVGNCPNGFLVRKKQRQQ